MAIVSGREHGEFPNLSSTQTFSSSSFSFRFRCARMCWRWMIIPNHNHIRSLSPLSIFSLTRSCRPSCLPLNGSNCRFALAFNEFFGLHSAFVQCVRSYQTIHQFYFFFIFWVCMVRFPSLLFAPSLACVRSQTKFKIPFSLITVYILCKRNKISRFCFFCLFGSPICFTSSCWHIVWRFSFSFLETLMQRGLRAPSSISNGRWKVL